MFKGFLTDSKAIGNQNAVVFKRSLFLFSSLGICTCINICSAANGAWGQWSSWGVCSATCGIGLQRRDRYCNDPYPEPNGEYCYREGIDHKICIGPSCSSNEKITKMITTAIINLIKLLKPTTCPSFRIKNVPL